MIVATTNEKVLHDTRTALGLDDSHSDIDEILIAAALRRIAGFTCPCPASTLTRVLNESLGALVNEEQRQQLREQAETIVERMVVHGDFLELESVTTAEPMACKGWLFAAPPAFVERPGRSVVLLGIVPDEPTPLPPALSARVVYDEHRRLIAPLDAEEDLTGALRDLGLLELSEDNWLKPPREESARGYLARHDSLLSQSQSLGGIEGLELLNPTTATTYYKARWTQPRRLTGTFVARRPQMYGSPIWGYARLADGVPSHFLDLPLLGARYRGCDAAWRLQAAIDYEQGHPQQFRVRSGPDGTSEFDFFGPLPSWVERRFMLIGKASQPFRAMISYSVPESEVAKTEMFLSTFLWLSKADE